MCQLLWRVGKSFWEFSSIKINCLSMRSPLLTFKIFLRFPESDRNSEPTQAIFNKSRRFYWFCWEFLGIYYEIHFPSPAPSSWRIIDVYSVSKSSHLLHKNILLTYWNCCNIKTEKKEKKSLKLQFTGLHCLQTSNFKWFTRGDRSESSSRQACPEFLFVFLFSL